MAKKHVFYSTKNNAYFLVCSKNTKTLDLIFLLDGSGSVGETNFEIVQNWVVKVAKNFDISDENNKVGVIQYSGSLNNRRLP